MKILIEIDNSRVSRVWRDDEEITERVSCLSLSHHCSGFPFLFIDALLHNKQGKPYVNAAGEVARDQIIMDGTGKLAPRIVRTEAAE